MERFEKALAKARLEKSASAPRDSTLAKGHKAVAPSEQKDEVVQAKQENEAVAEAYNGSIVALKFGDPTADLFRMLRTQVIKALAKKDSSTLGICSARAGEGKTFVAANLAASIALSQENPVLLIDLDLRRPGVHTHFHLSPNPGITDFLKGQAPLSDCIRSTAVPGLQVLPAGSPIRNSSEALGSSELSHAFADLRTATPRRILVCDLPPLLASDDALMFSSQVEAMLFVVEEGKTRPGELQRSLDLLASSNLVGTVLNKSRYNNPFPYSIYEAVES